MSVFTPFTPADVYQARKRIAPYVRHTPLVEAPELSALTGGSVVLKLENLQHTFSYKPRGAANRLLTLSTEERERGVITVSTGNHGRAVASISRRLGIKAYIGISQGVPEGKVQAIKDAGGEVLVLGATFDDALRGAAEFAQEHNVTLVHSFEDPYVMAGHATLGIELLEDFPDIDTLLVPSANAGLLMAIAVVLKAANPKVRMVAVSMERGAVLVPSLRAGHVVDFEELPTLADAIMGSLGSDPEAVFEAVRGWIDDGVMVSEEEIAAAMAFAFERHHQVVEGAGAVGIAALQSGKLKSPGRKTAVLVTGGNVAMPVLLNILQQYVRKV